MPSFRNARHVRHLPDQMLALVADVERYPEFLPFCESLAVRRRETREDGIEVIVADMRVGYKALREAFTSRVTIDRASRKILVEYIDGPFSFLENRWTFVPEPQGSDNAPGTRVDFYITYEFRSRMLALVAGAVFDRIFRMFSDAFVTRADQIYGRASSLSAAATVSRRT
jgi:coenzyme Q-binding protein COQ10